MLSPVPSRLLQRSRPLPAINDPSRVIFPLLRFRFTVNAFARALCFALHEIISNAALQPGGKWGRRPLAASLRLYLSTKGAPVRSSCDSVSFGLSSVVQSSIFSFYARQEWPSSCRVLHPHLLSLFRRRPLGSNSLLSSLGVVTHIMYADVTQIETEGENISLPENSWRVTQRCQRSSGRVEDGNPSDPSPPVSICKCDIPYRPK